MKRENIKNYISHITLITLFFAIMYGVGMALYSPSKNLMSDHQVSPLIHEGRLEIEKNYRETGLYRRPKVADEKISKLDYFPAFELKKDDGYVYSVSLKAGWDESYCIHENGNGGKDCNWR